MAQKIYISVTDTGSDLLEILKDRLISVGFNRDCFEFFDDESDLDEISMCVDIDNFEIYQATDITRKKNHFELDNHYDLDIIIEEIENNI